MATKGGKPFQSKLVPFEDLIRTERKRRRSYRQIAATLHEQHGLTVNFRTIQSFVKVRAKRPRGYRLPDPVADRPLTVIQATPTRIVANDDAVTPAPGLAATFNRSSNAEKKRLAIEAMKRRTSQAEPSTEATDEIKPNFEPGQAYRLTRLLRGAAQKKAG